MNQQLIKMSHKVTFSIELLQFMDEHSQLIQALPEFADVQTLIQMYRTMLTARILDDKAVKLQRRGQMGTYPSTLGQEAVDAGIGYSMRADDVFCPNYRDQGTMLHRGVSAIEILNIWGGDERGNDYRQVKEDLPIAIPIASQCLHAAGVAYAIQYRHQQRAVLTTIGDGGTSKGDFYEAINLAGVWNLPIVFVIINNQWAISLSRKQQTACVTLAQKAIAAGFSGVQVDGNDVIAVRYAVEKALEKARAGEGPTLIEAVCYRLTDHTTSDDATRYVPKEELINAWKKEPLNRLKQYLIANGHWSEQQDEQMKQICEETVNQSINAYLNQSPQPASAVFDFLYEQLPEAYLDQYEELTGKQS